MTSKQQFSGGHEPRTFFDRKIRQAGYTRVLSVGKVIPEDWLHVRLTVVEQSEKELLLKVQKMWGTEDNARLEKTDKKSKPHTQKTRSTNSHKSTRSKK